jgi:hypothetical protein
MIQLNARFFTVNAGLLTAVLSVACGTTPTGPSDAGDAVATSVQTSTAGTMATTQAASFRPAPIGCLTTQKLVLEVSNTEKLSVQVSSNYVATSKGCPHLTWTVSTKRDFVVDVDKLGRDIVTVYHNDPASTDRMVPTTVTALGPNGSASVDIFVR